MDTVRAAANPRLFPSRLLLAYAAGASGSLVMPIWLAAAVGQFHLTPFQAGLLGTAELGCAAAAALLTALLRDARLFRRLLLAALLVAIAANLASTVAPGAAMLAAARIAAGLASGAVLALATRGAAQRPDAQRYFAAQMFAFVGSSILFFGVAPMLVGWLGFGAPFAFCAALGAVTLAMQWLPDPVAVAAGPAPTHAQAASGLALSLVFGGITVVFCCQYAVYAYIAEGGRQAGLGLDPVSKLLALASLAGLAGPIAAERLTALWGRLGPLAIGVTGLGLSSLLVMAQSDPRLFAAGAVGISLFLMYLAPILLGLLAHVDPTGRAAGSAPAFFMIGAALGPAIGGWLIDVAGLRGLGVTVAAAEALALAVILLAVRRRAASSGPAQAV